MTEAALTVREDAAPPAPRSESASVISMIDRAARDQSVDIDKMERLMRMRKEMMAEQAERDFLAAMSAAQSEMRPVARDAQNDHTKSHYARLETISDAVTPIYTKHGFSLSFSPADCPKEGHYRLTCLVGHHGGHKQVVHADLPSDGAGSQGKTNKTPIQAFGSTMSYGRRYLTLMIFNIVLKNEDNDGNTSADRSVITDDQCDQLNKLIVSTRSNLDVFLKYFRIECVPDLLAKDFPRALDMLNRKAVQS